MIKKYSKRDLQLIEAIHNNPGIQFRQLMKKTGMKNGVLSYHTNKIERHGLVKVERKPRQTRFYPLSISVLESKIIKFLRRQTTRDILLCLLANKNVGLQFSEIVKKIGKSPSTISYYLNQLVSEDILMVDYVNLKKKFFVKETKIIDKLIDRYTPGSLDRSIDSFTEIINSL